MAHYSRTTHENKPWAPPPGFVVPEGKTAVRCAAYVKSKRMRDGSAARCRWVAAWDSLFCVKHQDPTSRGGITDSARDALAAAFDRERTAIEEWKRAPGDAILAPTQCQAETTRGTQCLLLALPSLSTCRVHTTREHFTRAYMGAPLAVQNLIRAVLDAEGRAILSHSLTEMIDVQLDLARDTATPHGVRQRAAADLLDRAGVSRRMESALDVQLHTPGGDDSPDPLTALTERLNEIASRASAPHQHADEVDAAALPVLDAEVIEDDTSGG